ncbi:hypothetical protein CSUB01_12563 [Colletotrichum sublineola]|uniref:DNA2/NAM7 helicase helicase domain-containing protein n=1 Tax=Colletotrichum sublineola TaxID=1173701 RepID=A0A066XLJ1_COLSU|nr:hypothetical protein CSUB01_12563 [Colletotrichum sublineola]
MFSPLENDDGQLSTHKPMSEAQYNNQLSDSSKPEDEQTVTQGIQQRSNRDPDDEERWQRVQSRSRSDRAHALAIPLTKGCRKAVLVGDHVQLRPTAGQLAPSLDFDISLFERL